MRNFYNNLKQMVMVGNNPDSILSRFSLVSLILMTIGVGNAWGWNTSGTAIHKDGDTYYVLYATGEENFSTISDKEYTISGPGAQLYYEAKCVPIKVVFEYYGGDLKVAQKVGGKWSNEMFSEQPPKNSYKNYGPIALDRNATNVKLYTTTGATGKKYMQNVKVTMAQYIDDPSATSLTCETKELGSVSTNNNVTIAWCNVPAMSYNIKDDADGVFSVSVSNNSEVGKWNTATFTVTCDHTKKAGNHTAKLEIKDTYGSYSKTINLSATTTKHPNSISWTEDESTKKNWEQEMTMTATASNTDYTNYPIQYSSSNNAYASVSGNVVTFHAAGAGETVTIYANQETSATYLAPTQVSKTFTIKASQNIVWDATKVDTNIRAGKSRDINGYAYGEPSDPNGVRVITYSSSNSDTISVSGTTITAKSLIGSVDIIATLAGDADYNEVTSRKTFTVKERETVEYYFDGALIEENAKLNLLVGDTSGVVTSKNTERAITYTTSSSAVAIYNTETKRIEAKGEGEATIHLIQEATDDYQNGNRAVMVKVALHTTTITTNVSDTTMEVGDTYNPKLSTTNDEVTMNVSSSNSDVAVYENGVIKAKGAGSATITFRQDKTTKWSGDTATIAVTVNKKNPTITVSSVPETAWNQTITPVITSTNTDEDCAITFEKISGADAAARQFGEDIKVYDKNGETVTFLVTQTGNGKWNEATKNFSFTVQKASNHVTFTYGSNLSASKGKETSIIEFTGVPSSISCGLEEDAILDTYFYLYEATSASGQFTQVGGEHKNGTSLTESLSPSTRAIKFKFDGASGVGSSKVGTFKNITITEHEGEIKVEGLKNNYFDFGSSYEVGNPATDKAVAIKWYNVPTTTVTSSNPGVFDVITETVNSEIDDFNESTSITIRYHHKAVTVGDKDEATITLTSENGYVKTFKVKGKTNKKDQTLIWQDELTPISVGDVIPNPAIAPLALNYSIAETTEEGVVDVVDGVLKAKKVGTVTLHVANDGDAMWNPIQGDYTIKVTDLKVQRLNWDQTFTRLKTGDADVPLNASVYEVVNGEKQAITARSVTYTTDSAHVVTVVNGKLHIVGKGTATITARVAGVEGEYEPAEVVRKVKVRTASTGCNPTVYADANGYDMKTSITDFTGTEKIHKLNGEPASVSFRAWRVAILGFSDGDIFVGQSKDNGSSWQELKQFSLNEGEDNAKDCGPVALDRNATHIKIYKKTGATGYHDIRNIEVTKAKYLELEDVANRTTTSVAFDDSHLGQTYIQSVVVNYSNIYDMLYVNHTNKNFRITPTEIGNSCGEDGRATITIIYYAKDAITEKDTITVTDEHGLTATIYVSASVAKSDQTITWNPETTLNTTDAVSYDASASSELPVTYSVREQDAEVATVTEAGVLTIKKAGEIQVTASQAGSNLYNPTSLTKTFTISKVTPSVSVKPTAPEVTLPNKLSASELNVSAAVMVDDKSNEVVGSYAWTAPTTALVDGAQNCEVTFTPTKTDWYNPTTFNVSVTANKRNQVITWDVADGKTWPCSEIIELNAVLTDSVSGDELEEALTYSSNNTECAEILEGQLYIKTPGTVTITVSRAGSAVYNAASITRTFTFEKVTPTIDTLPTAHSIYQEQWLHESALVDGVVTASGHEVPGHFAWTAENFMAVYVGTQSYAAVFVPANEACYNRVTCEVPMTILQFERVFTDSQGNENWNDSANWSNGFVPPAEVSVTIGANVKIDTEDTVQVGTMTVNEGKTVTVTSTSEVSVGTINLTEGSTLVVSGNSHMTIGNSTEDSNEQYGDVYVKESATLTIDNSLKVNNVIMEATLNGGDQDATSSQIEGADKIEINGDAFIDITFDPNGQISYGWYDFVVPFEVNMHGGIARINSADDKVLVYNVDFVLIEADEVARAQGGKAWKRKNSGVLVPGKLYSISFDDEVVQNTFRFTWNRNGSIANGNSYDAQYADAMDDGVKGWNGMGNGMMRHGRIADGLKVQAYNHANNVYELVDGNKTFAVGTAFFVQATQAGAINWTAASADNAHPLFAPARAPKATEEFKLTLRQDGARKAADILYFSASEEATETYMIGHDLVKMGTPTEAAVAQMWTTKGGKTLCDVEKKLENDNAATPLMFFAPKAQEFTLSVEKAPADADLYLTYNDNIIWDLSANPYIMDLSKGTTSGYGLLMMTRKAPAVATGVDNADANSQKVRKVLVDGQLYIITPEGAMYNVTGKIVR